MHPFWKCRNYVIEYTYSTKTFNRKSGTAGRPALTSIQEPPSAMNKWIPPSLLSLQAHRVYVVDQTLCECFYLCMCVCMCACGCGVRTRAHFRYHCRVLEVTVAHIIYICVHKWWVNRTYVVRQTLLVFLYVCVCVGAGCGVRGVGCSASR